MTMRFTVLGSGSGGNCTVLSTGASALPEHTLIDCGLSPRQVRLRLGRLDDELHTVTAIAITHFDGDHFHPGWLKEIEQHGIPVFIHERHRRRAAQRGLSGRHMEIYTDEATLPGGITLSAEPAAHDIEGSITFVLEHAGTRLGWATDLGKVHPELEERLCDLDALAIESNYDRAMQLRSGRPEYLIRRVIGGRGHLSNEQALRTVQSVSTRSSLRHVVLLHLSRQCNCPDLLQSLYEREAPELARRLIITHQTKPTPWIEVEAGVRARQLEMWDA